jgi:hypothetical protein
MGAWGIGLYSNDMAVDMRALVESALRLPFDEDRIVEIIRECEPTAADDNQNEDHTTFWLVLADQFQKRGVVHVPTREKAIGIIDRGDDLAMMERLGMKPADLRKRGAKLVELRERLATHARPSKPRTTLKEPQPYVFEVGVLYACPVKGSAAINPYMGKKNHDGSQWVADGWRQFVVLERGRAFDYLAWYQPIVCKKPVKEKPRLEDASDDLWWELETPKTCSPHQFGVMEIETLGPLPIDLDKARTRFPKTRPGVVYLGWGGRSAAVNNISIGDAMFPSSYDWERWYGPKNITPTEGPTVICSLETLLAG